MRKDAWPYAALFLACGLVMALAWQLRELRADYAESLAAQRKPETGAWVPVTEARQTNGQVLELGRASGAVQILYFFDPECAYCEASVPAIRQVLAALAQDHPRVEFVGLAKAASTQLEHYGLRRGLGFPVVHITPKIHSLFGLKMVPLLVAVDRDSRVIYSHAGVLDTTDEVEALLTAVRATDRRVVVSSQRNEP